MGIYIIIQGSFFANNENMLSALWKYRQDNNAILDLIIVGIKFKIEHIEGSLKMNQHHIEGNRLGVIEGLRQSPNAINQAAVEIISEL